MDLVGRGFVISNQMEDMLVMKCPTNAYGKSVCAEKIRELAMKAGRSMGDRCEIEVSSEMPKVHSLLHQPQLYECPHGNPYWIQPTLGQLVDWARRMVP